VYGKIISAGVYEASSIKVAEASKVIENTQRDLNIALMNELAIIFNKIGIDTEEVLRASGTKWNFLPFRPGLVGGHCIGVDPYYLTYKAEKLGYHPQVILSGRRINDSMASYVAQKTVKEIIRNGGKVAEARIIVLGMTFKENCTDLRNSKVANLIYELNDFGCKVSVHDPLASSQEAIEEYGIELNPWHELPNQVDAIIAAVSHSHYTDMMISGLLSKLRPGGIFIDIKSRYSLDEIVALGFKVWRL